MIKMNFIFCAALLWLFAWVTSSNAAVVSNAATPKASGARFKSPDFERINEIWSSILRLVSAEGGYVSHDDFERNIGIRYIPGKQVLDDGTNRGLTYYNFFRLGSDWSPRVTLINTTYQNGSGAIKISSIGITFRQFSQDPCLPITQAVINLKENGWQKFSSLDSVMVFKNLKGGYRARVTSKNGCLDSFLVDDPELESEILKNRMSVKKGL